MSAAALFVKSMTMDDWGRTSTPYKGAAAAVTAQEEIRSRGVVTSMTWVTGPTHYLASYSIILLHHRRSWSEHSSDVDWCERNLHIWAYLFRMIKQHNTHIFGEIQSGHNLLHTHPPTATCPLPTRWCSVPARGIKFYFNMFGVIAKRPHHAHKSSGGGSVKSYIWSEIYVSRLRLT
jgi:hypothetical protein